jgi:DNA invertase Pin-like site-specific DNA recombinase
MKRAIAYVSDIILGRTGEVIKRSCQVELIAQYAADNDTEIIGWFEDEMYNEDVLMRPGIRALLSCDKPYDLVICERVWALSRSMAALEPFFKELDRRGVKLESATMMWDCVSQQCRRRFRGPARAKSRPAPAVAKSREAEHASVARPAHLHFAHLVK